MVVSSTPEAKDFSTELLQSFGLVKEYAALMTDEGSGFTEVAVNLGMIHVLCSQNFQKKGLKSHIMLMGMHGKIKDDYISGYNKLIFHDFITEDEYVEFYASLMKKLKDDSTNHAGAEKFLAGLYEAQGKVCFFYTKCIFTCGHMSTARAEGTNSRIKVQGELKKELKQADLYHGVTRVLGIFDSQEIKAVDLLEKLITSNKEWSDFVDEAWRESATLASNFSDIEPNKNLSDDKVQVWSVISSHGGVSCSV